MLNAVLVVLANRRASASIDASTLFKSLHAMLPNALCLAPQQCLRFLYRFADVDLYCNAFGLFLFLVIFLEVCTITVQNQMM